MKHYLSLLFLSSLFAACAGYHSSRQSAFERIVGNDRDEHGCIASAGYTYSYALHDCVRLWEAGERYYAGNHQLFVVFSPDSMYAEVFPPEGNSIICKRHKSKMRWERRRGSEYVEQCNGQTYVSMGKLIYTSVENQP